MSCGSRHGQNSRITITAYIPHAVSDHAKRKCPRGHKLDTTMTGSPPSATDHLHAVRNVCDKSARVSAETELDVGKHTPAAPDPPNPVDVLSHVAAFQPGLEIRFDKFPGDVAKRAPG